MANQYIGEIRMFAGTFAPAGWAMCNGATMSISENSALYNLLGTTYGGDGVQTFNVPDLQCRVPVNQGQGSGLSNYVLGQKAGVETVALTTAQLPAHSHTVVGSSSAAGSGNPAGATWGTNNAKSFAPGTSANAAMNPGSVRMTGNNVPHDNMLPFVVLTFIISLTGIYPSQN
jgi:microcystin-dependent protein